MSLFIDLILEAAELIGAGIGPESDRGLVATFSVGSGVFLAVAGWLLATSPDPLRRPGWGLVVYVGSILIGASGILVSTLHLRRNESDRLFSSLCLLINAAAVAIPMWWILAH
jgi:hypothetical protein